MLSPDGHRGWVRGLIFGVAAALVVELGLTAAPTPAAAGGPPLAPAAPASRGAATAPDEASARLTAALRNRDVLISEATTETTRSWALPDGSTRTEVAAGPVRVHKAGGWTDVDSTLVDSGDGVHPKAAPAAISFSGGGNTRLARVAGGSTPGARASGTNPSGFGLDWGEVLPKPVLSGSQATYNNVAPNTDLTVQALPQGFTHWLTVKKRPTTRVSDVRLPLRLKDLQVKVGAGGQLRLVDGKGRLRAKAPAPLMWDSAKDPASGLPARQVPVKVRVEGVANAQVLVLTPDARFLNDPATQYPVTIDPTTTLYVTADVTVQTNKTTSQSGTADLQAGTYNGGGVKARSLLKFDVSALKGRKVTAADLALNEIWSSSCVATPVEVRRATASWDPATVLWTTQPSLASTVSDSVTAAYGYSASCPENYRHFKSAGMATLVQGWADGTYPNYGLALKATNETDSQSWKRWNSANYGGTKVPRLTVTYNSYPGVGTGRSVSPCHSGCTTGAVPTNARRPILTTDTRDPDGGSLRHSFEIYAGHDAAPSVLVTSGTSDQEASGTRVTWSPPIDLAPGNYEYRVRAYDGQLYGPWSTTYYKFTVDLTPPTAPGVSGSLYKSDGQWYGSAGTADTFTLTPNGADTATLTYWLDSGPRTVVTTSTATTVSVTPPSDGPHTLSVQARDRAGNSAVTTYAFNVGAGATTSPGNGDRSARRFLLSATGKTTVTGVTFQYRRGAADTWRDVPAAHVRRGDGSAVTWPVPTAVAGSSAKVDNLRWDAVATLAGDGAVELKAVFSGTTGASQPVSVVVDQTSSGAETEEIGPGSVNLLTGNYALSDSDGGPFGLSVSRTTSSRDPKSGEKVVGLVAPYGPEWAVGGVGDADAPYQAVRRTSPTSVQVVLDDGTWVEFLRGPGTGTATTWKPEPGSEDLKLTGDGSTTAPFILADVDGGSTRFKSGAGPLHVVETTTPASATAANTTRYSFEPATVGGLTKLRLKRLIAPTSAVTSAATCDVAAPPTGCRVLELVYTADAVAKPAAGTTGAYPGRVASLALWATAPGGTGTVKTVLATYTYDDAGRLRTADDPRVTGLRTSYGYDATGRVTSLAPAGELPWSFDYANLNLAGDTNAGRLTKVRRPTLAPGTADAVNGEAVQTVVYGVPLAGTGSPRDLTENATRAWGQTGRAAPSDATGVFPADWVPATNVADATVRWSRATVTYLDVNGRSTNTLTPGNHLDFTAYDGYGNQVQTLSARNRDLAVAAADDVLLTELGLQNASSAERAYQLSEVGVYSSDGQRELQSFGPLHLLRVPGAAEAKPGRTHTANSYDEGRPATGALASNLVTTVAIGARLADARTDADVRTTRTEYNWTLGVPTKATTDPGTGHLNIASVTAYDSQGRVTRTSQPKSSGTDAGTTLTRYYTAAAHPEVAACGNKPAWADLVCQVGPAAGITGAASGQPTKLPTSTSTYTGLGDPDAVTESSSDGAATAKTRRTDTDYDAAGRPVKVTVSGDVGAALPVLTTAYDPTTGDKVSTTATSGTTASVIRWGYDKLGRPTSYTDADGATSTTSYDALDRPVRMARGDGSSTSYEYDLAAEPRGLLTSLTDSVAGRLAARYNADGGLVQQDLPGGISMRRIMDRDGSPTSQWWSRTNADGTKTPLLHDQVQESAHGQWLTRNGRLSDQEYGYDAAGRLTTVKDVTNSACTVRLYGFDANSNRTQRRSASGAVDACPAAPALSSTPEFTYDLADRVSNTGYTYDAFGRTTKLPGTDAVNYYVNDLAASVRKSASDTQSWTLDPALRFRSSTRTRTDATGTATSVVKTNHYSGDNDSPDWITEAAGVGAPITRNVGGIDGDLVATTSATGNVHWQLTNLHGDVALDLDTVGTTVAYDSDEYGNPKVNTPVASRYGWLGGKQRSGETPTGLILMGVRLYNSATGRFLSVDPVPGGNPNAYTYPVDPVNMYDLDGRWGCRWCHRAAGGLAAVSRYSGYVPFCGVCSAVSAVTGYASAGLYLANRDYTRARRQALGTTFGVAFGGFGHLKAAKRFGSFGRRIYRSRAVKRYHIAGRRWRGANYHFDQAARSAGRGHLTRRYWHLHLHGAGLLGGWVAGRW